MPDATVATPRLLPAHLRLVFWELTTRCNLSCRHCRAEATSTAPSGELSTAEALRVAAAIRRDADPILVLTGGEPLERPDFFPIAEACARSFTRVAMATNGTRIDDALARRLVETGIQRVSISFDGVTPATHDAFRGVPGSLQAALRGFDALRGAGMSMQANVTVTRYNLDELAPLLDLMLERGADAFHVFLLVPVGCGAELDDAARLSPQQTEDVLGWLYEQSLALRERIHLKATCAPMYFRILRERARATKTPLPGGRHGLHAATRGCLAGSGVCFISSTGDVQPCGYLPLVAGNVRERPLGDIWRDADLFAVLRDTGRLAGKCGACGYKVACQGCRARAYAATGDPLGEEPDCPYCPPGYAGSEVAP